MKKLAEGTPIIAEWAITILGNKKSAVVQSMVRRFEIYNGIKRTVSRRNCRYRVRQEERNQSYVGF